MENRYNVVFMYRTDAVKGSTVFKTLELSENMEIEDALKLLLKGQGLEFKPLNPKTYGIFKVEKILPASLFNSIQENIIGTVTDAETGETLPGVNIVVKGTRTGTSTDADGNYALTVASLQETLLFSYVGFQTLEEPIDGRSTVNVQLHTEAVIGEELVVTGYQTQRKVDLTGAISVVDVDEIENISTSSPMRALQGQVAGLYVQTDGNPRGNASRIHIRGLNTLGNNSPLYIIDGVPTKRSMAFQSLNSNTIESIQVLKDAASASIYGSRAANGVIIVTTKKGSSQEGVQVRFNSNMSFQTEKPQRVDVLNTEEWGRALWQGAVNDGTNPDAIGDIFTYDWHIDGNGDPVLDQVNPSAYVGGDALMPVGDTDWQDEFYSPGFITKNNLGISTGSENSNLAINLSHYNDDYMMPNTFYERYNFKVNSSAQFYDGRLKLGENLEISKSSENLAKSDLGGASTPGLAVILAPTIPVYRTDGEFAGALGGGYTDRNNPIHMQHLGRWNRHNEITTFGNIYADLEVIDNLVFRTSFGVDYSNRYSRSINPRFQEGFMSREVNNMSIGQVHYTSLSWSNTFNYRFELANNQFDFLLGTEAVQIDFTSHSAYQEEFAIQEDNYFILDAGTGLTRNGQSSTGNRLLSYFTKVNWSLDNKYLASLTLRRDGSSRFGDENKFGYFPALSVGWRISNESFFDNITFVSDLKFRAGVGRTGNDEIGDAARYGLYEPNYGALYQGTSYDITGANSGTLPSGYRATQGANNILQWENTEELNVGVDFGFLQNKLTGSFDYFTRETTGILIRPPVAAILGEGQSTWYNGASAQNKGFELVLGYNNSINDLSYSVNTNISRFLDEITELPEQVRTNYAGNEEKDILGRSQTAIFGYKTDGLFQTQEEVDAHAHQPGKGLGRIRYVDLNDDGVIDALDQDWLGNSVPEFEYGIRINLGYKNFDLSLFGSGVAGKTGYDPRKGFNSFLNGGSNNGTGVLDAWTPQNPDSNIPMLSLVDNNNEGRSSDYFWVNGSYFKIRHVEIGYNLPASVLQRIGVVQDFRVFVMGDNLFWFKDNTGKDAFTGSDPEAIGGLYPRPTSFTVGIDIKFN
ncbi:MAG: TonB-dependent receptor [Balneolaceae bacterium]